MLQLMILQLLLQYRRAEGRTEKQEDCRKEARQRIG